jgi:16S rRNA (cytidine1402-2'-O)-methyltransferase
MTGTLAAANKGCLYLVPNTLGSDSLMDCLPTSVKDLTSGLTCFVGENAKSTRAFLKLIGMQRPIQEIDVRVLDVNTPDEALTHLLQPLLQGIDVGLVSEAGCPAVADPGSRLVRLAHANSIRVRPLVGPNSLLLALMASGLNGQRFAFHGYLPTDALARAERLKFLESESRRLGQTQLFIETPYRNAAMLDAMVQNLARSTRVCIATDLTLPSESIVTMPAWLWKGQSASLNKRPSVFLLLADA